VTIASKPLEDLVREVPPELRAEIRDFIESLLSRRARGQGGTLRQDWAGSLSDYRHQYTSLDLQREALSWRGD